MIVFERRDRSRVWRMRDAFAVTLLFVLSQTAWTSAQEPTTSTDVSHHAAVSCEGRHSVPSCIDGEHDASGLLSIGRAILDRQHERQDVQTTDAGVVREEGSRRIDSDPIPPQVNDTDVRWGSIIRQTLSFHAIQHAFLLTEQKARRELRGPWFRDWFQSAASPFVEPHWSDGGSFLVNYIAHPMGGSVYAYIYRQNDPSGMRMEFGGSKGYVAHLAKASGIAALSSLQWEIGPFSEASLENRGKPPDRYKMAWVDVVITPTLGVAWMAGEDALDRYVIERLERKIDNAAGRVLIRMLLNPTRSMASLMAGQKPWKRHARS